MLDKKLEVIQNRLTDIYAESGLARASLHHAKQMGEDGAALVGRLQQLAGMDVALRAQGNAIVQALRAMEGRS